jgi:hypothetical protein
VPVSQPLRPIARLATELRTSGAGQIVIGLAGLLAALAIGDLSVGRSLVPFVVVLVLVGGISLWSTRWLRDPELPEAGGGGAVEPANETVRRTMVVFVLPLVFMAVVVALVPAGAVALAGVVAGVGAVDLRNFAWVRARERELGRGIYRELGPSTFTSGRRPLYTRP